MLNLFAQLKQYLICPMIHPLATRFGMGNENIKHQSQGGNKNEPISA